MHQETEPGLRHALHVPSPSIAPAATGRPRTSTAATAATSLQHTAAVAHTRNGRPQGPRRGRVEKHTRGKFALTAGTVVVLSFNVVFSLKLVSRLCMVNF